MGSGHGHAHPMALTAGGRNRKPLLIAFGLTATYMVVQVVAGLLMNSLALLSDAAHMGTDVLGLGMALAAITLAQRPATSDRSFGAYRLEVLAALANGVLLFAVAGYILYVAAMRISDPPEVPGLPMLVVAVGGLVVNLISFRLLLAGSKESLNVRGAYFEVLADMLGSIGVIVAATVIFTTGWPYADPIIGAAIGLFILPRTWKLSGQALRILMQSAPEGMDVDAVRDRLLGLPGVAGVHELHIWTLTSGMDTATGHVVVDEGEDYHDVLDRVIELLERDYGLTHTTIQCEPPNHRQTPTPI